MNIWLVMLTAGVLTYLTRLSFIWLFEKTAMPPLLQRALRFVPPAVLSVIIFQELLIRDGKLALGWDNARLLAGIVAMLVAWRTRSPLLTIVAGMATLLAINALVR
ncbi:MAG: AzlD domain-containing protein [Anaerolineaceae bacterium]|nr:AzlD domain-containing protein [Anaerolineaceae bacterium]